MANKDDLSEQFSKWLKTCPVTHHLNDWDEYTQSHTFMVPVNEKDAK